MSERAHPRSRGENVVDHVVVYGAHGSSPLTRGKQGDSLAAWRRSGLIPAHAGKTPPANMPRPASWAHPRSRGENMRNREPRSPPRGSSPLTRGKHGPRRRPPPARGLIPAHAGKTDRARPACQEKRAHPRSRGENKAALGPIGPIGGSSPLTRGKPGVRRSLASRRGLIPAHAGKTRGHARAFAVRAAHPRSRGENVSAMTRPAPPMGSSPLTRGKLGGASSLSFQERLIPAHAGKTCELRIIAP